jgi:peptidoglycan hydrolase CwlO-like protein
MSRFDSVMISRARTDKIENLEKELDEEVKELNNLDKEKAAQIGSAKLSRAKRERDLQRLLASKERNEIIKILYLQLRGFVQRRIKPTFFF